MLVKHVHHVSFSVRDLARAREFYEGVLGLRVIPRPDFGLAGMWYGVGEGQIHLIQRRDGEELGSAPEKLTPLANHCAFAIDDYDATVEHLKRSGVQVLETRSEIGQLWVQDPDGNVIELIRPRPA
jgi:catechol 2,3-dioxygenase-like lactoylglutathione lyase family enzyme